MLNTEEFEIFHSRTVNKFQTGGSARDAVAEAVKLLPGGQESIVEEGLKYCDHSIGTYKTTTISVVRGDAGPNIYVMLYYWLSKTRPLTEHKKKIDRQVFGQVVSLAQALGSVDTVVADEGADLTTEDWDKSQHYWYFEQMTHAPFDPEFASIGLTCTQSSSAAMPLDLIAEVYADTVYDADTEITLGFKAFRIIVTSTDPSARFHQEPSSAVDVTNNGSITVKGSSGAPFYQLETRDRHLSGNYTTIETPFLSITPEAKTFELTAVLKVDKGEANAVFPKGMELPPKIKRSIIERILTNEKFPN